MTTTAIAPAERTAQILKTSQVGTVGTLRDMLKGMEPQIAARVVKGVDPGRLIQVAITAVQSNPKLLECTPMSIAGGIITTAELGLDLNPRLGQAYLVPFNNNKTKRYEAQFIPGYKGLVKLVCNGGLVSSVQAFVVHENDEFDYARGTDPYIKHRPCDREDHGPLTHAYAIANLKDGSKIFDVRARWQIDAARKRSRAKDSGPWVTDFDAMARKTPIRRIANDLPQSADPMLLRALEYEDRFERGMSQNLASKIMDAEVIDDPLDALANAVESKDDARHADADGQGEMA